MTTTPPPPPPPPLSPQTQAGGLSRPPPPPTTNPPNARRGLVSPTTSCHHPSLTPKVSGGVLATSWATTTTPSPSPVQMQVEGVSHLVPGDYDNRHPLPRSNTRGGVV